MSYTLWKLIHIIGVVMFLGNITTGLFWAAHSHRQKEFRLIASTFSGINRSDRWFTVPGVVAILVGGFGVAINGSIPILRTGWVLWPIILFSISGIVFGALIAPLQQQIKKFVQNKSKTQENWIEYCSLYKRWEFWGILAWLTPVVALIIMILKPPLPGI